MRISDWSSDVCSSDLTPYTRYFLARLLQFQFYKAACDQAGWKGPLHRCSFYGNEKVGQRLNAMLELGASKPWPDALEAFTGAREMDGTAMIAYFRPLMTWLEEQNKGRSEQHTSELQSLMSISYAVFCLKKKTHQTN